MRDRTLPLQAGMALCIALAGALAFLLLTGATDSYSLKALAVLLVIGLVAVGVLTWMKLRQIRDRVVALRDSQVNLAALLDSIPEGLFMTDLEGRVTAINKTSAAAMGHTPGSAVGKMITDLADDKEASDQLIMARLGVIDSKTDATRPTL